MFCTQI